jgi:ribosome-associated heat shock protein Hsp15
MDIKEVRLDKYLWAIRLCKTRSLASELIEGGKVKVDGNATKPSKKVKIGEIYRVHKDEIIKEIKVLKLLDKRLSASLVVDFYEEISSVNLNENKKQQSAFFFSKIEREKGAGRPTKKERREIDRFGED